MDFAGIVQSAIGALPDELLATCVFSRTLPGTYDPLTDTRAGDQTETFTVSGPLLPVQADQLLGVAADELARFRQLLVAAADAPFTPSATDTTCVINGETWRVVDCLPVDPTGALPVMYTVRLRR